MNNYNHSQENLKNKSEEGKENTSRENFRRSQPKDELKSKKQKIAFEFTY